MSEFKISDGLNEITFKSSDDFMEVKYASQDEQRFFDLSIEQATELIVFLQEKIELT